MNGDEMVEKARAWALKCAKEKSAEGVDSIDVYTLMASFARLAVRDAVREIAPYLRHGADCAHYHAWKPKNCDCGLSALRKKFEVEG